METALSTPYNPTTSAIKMQQYSFTIIPSENKVRATMYFVDANGALVQIKECEFTDPAVTNAIIGAGQVGKKYIDILMQSIQTHCKAQWGLSGSDT